MKIISPLEISDAIFTNSNVPEDDFLVYDPTTHYERGEYCISIATHTVYRSLEDGNLDNDPDLEQIEIANPFVDNPDPIQWQIMASTNKWRAFDEKPSHLCKNPDSIEIELTPAVFIQGVAMFAVDAISVEITMTDPNEGVVYSKTIGMFDPTVVIDWFTYYFEPHSTVSEFALTDLPPFADAVLSLVLHKEAGFASVGQVVVGHVSEIGFNQFDGTGFSGLDFSYVSNDEFGNLTTTRREATRLADYSVVVDSSALLGIDAKLKSLRGGSPAVWVGGPDVAKAVLTYGFYRDYRVDYASIRKSIIAIQVQGTV